MKAEFCVVAKPDNSSVYKIINHEPLEKMAAVRLKDTLKENDARLTRYAYAKSMVNFLNTEIRSDLKPDDELLAELEMQISMAVKRYVTFAGRKGKKIKIDEVFVGRENYEVQVTLGEE